MDRFDKEIRNKIDLELKDIKLSQKAVVNIENIIKSQESFNFKKLINNFLNYELRIPYRVSIACILIVVILGINSVIVTPKDISFFINKNLIKISKYEEVGK